MTTLIVPLTPALAKQLARIADRCEMTHEQVGREAVRLFVRAYETNGGGQIACREATEEGLMPRLHPDDDDLDDVDDELEEDDEDLDDDDDDEDYDYGDEA